MAKNRRRPVDPRVRTLAVRFEEFRKTHPRRTKIPEELREGALAAMAQGVPAAAIRSACGVAKSQLEYWQRQDKTAAPPKEQQEAAEIFSVIEPDTRREDCLELRLGAWSVTIRLDGARGE